MTSRTMFCLAIISAFGPSGSLISGADKTIVTDINANKLLSTIASEHNFSVVMILPEKAPVVMGKDTPPGETLTIMRENDSETRGRRYGFRRDAIWAGEIQLGVFSDPNAALQVFEDHLRHTSLGPDRDLGTAFGTKAVAWSQGQDQSTRRVLFVRDNVVVSVYLALWRLVSADVSKEATLEIARRIDGALVKAMLGVQRGPNLRVPNIVAIETLGEMSAQAKFTAQVRIAIPENPQDKESKEIEVVRTLPFHTPGLNPEDKAKSLSELPLICR